VKFDFYSLLIPKKLRDGNPDEPKLRSAMGRFAGWASIYVNLILFIAKLVAGLMIKSIALIADAVHSLSDVATSIIVIVGYKISDKPADAEHPYGHQRAEYIATLIISILLCVAGLEFIREAVKRFQNPQVSRVGIGILVFIVFTILVKYALGKFADKIAKRIHSGAVKADSLHHYTDALSSVLVLIAVWGSDFGYKRLDGVGGILVGIILIWAGYSIAREAADLLLGKPPTPEMVREIRKTCRSIKNVLNAHDIAVHSYGNRKFIGVHVEVDQKKSSTIAHEIADHVEDTLRRKFDAYSMIHVDPVDMESEDVKKANAILDRIVSDSAEIKEYHDLRLVKKPGYQLVIFDLVPIDPVNKRCEDFNECEELKRALREAFPGCEVHVTIDPVYVFN